MCCLEIMTERLKSETQAQDKAKIALSELEALTLKLDHSLQLSGKSG